MNIPEGVRITVGYPRWLRLLLMRNVIAITFGRRIWIAHHLPEEEMERLLRHELVHVRQMVRRGVILFVVSYVTEYAANRIRGMDHETAYRSISFEREAFEAEDAR